MRDTLEELYSTLRRSKLRTTLTGISVSTGIFLLIVLLGAGNGIIHAFSNMAGSMVLDVMSVYGGATSKPYHGLNAGRVIQLDDRDIDIALHNMSGQATAASGTSSKDNITLRLGSSTLSRSLTAVDPSYVKMDRNASEPDCRPLHRPSGFGREEKGDGTLEAGCRSSGRLMGKRGGQVYQCRRSDVYDSRYLPQPQYER